MWRVGWPPSSLLLCVQWSAFSPIPYMATEDFLGHLCTGYPWALPLPPPFDPFCLSCHLLAFLIFLSQGHCYLCIAVMVLWRAMSGREVAEWPQDSTEPTTQGSLAADWSKYSRVVLYSHMNGEVRLGCREWKQAVGVTFGSSVNQGTWNSLCKPKGKGVGKVFSLPASIISLLGATSHDLHQLYIATSLTLCLKRTPGCQNESHVLSIGSQDRVVERKALDAPPIRLPPPAMLESFSWWRCCLSFSFVSLFLTV